MIVFSKKKVYTRGVHVLEISKQIERSISRDTGILAATKDFFITSNGRGVTIFDVDLNMIREILPRDDLVIQHIYTNFSKNQLILYCPDNACVVWIDILSVTHKEIPLSEKWLEEVKFSPAYHWRGDLAIFVDSIVTDHDWEDFYGVNLPNAMWGRISRDILEATNPQLAYLVCTICCNHLSYMHLRDGYIIVDCAEDHEVTVVVYHNHFALERPKLAYHDILYGHNLIAFLGDTQIEAFVPAGEVHDRTYQSIAVKAKEGYLFLKAVIVQGDAGLQLVTLSKSTQDQRDSLLTVFRAYGVHQ